MRQKIELYIISLWFLFLLLFVNKIHIPICFKKECEFIGWTTLLSQNIIPTLSVVFICLGLFYYWTFNYKFAKGAANNPWQIISIENLNFESLSFLTTYIIPLLCFDLDFNLDEGRNTLMFILVLILIGAIYVKTNLFYTNPTLALLGYHVYRIKTLSQNNIIVISRSLVNENDWVTYKEISDNIYYIKVVQNDFRGTS